MLNRISEIGIHMSIQNLLREERVPNWAPNLTIILWRKNMFVKKATLGKKRPTATLRIKQPKTHQTRLWEKSDHEATLGKNDQKATLGKKATKSDFGKKTVKKRLWGKKRP